MIENRDRAMMARAVQLAWRGRYSTHPNPRVGCVIARGDLVQGEGWHVYIFYIYIYIYKWHACLGSYKNDLLQLQLQLGPP